MKNLFMVLCPNDEIKKLIVTDFFCKHIIQGKRKTIILYPESFGSIWFGDTSQAQSLAYGMAVKSNTPALPMPNIVEENLRNGSYREFWKYLNGWDSKIGFDNIWLILPLFMAQKIKSGCLAFQYQITGKLFTELSTLGEIASVCFETHQNHYEIQHFINPLFDSISTLPWQLLYTGYRSEDGKNPKDIMNNLIIKWLETSKGNSHSRNVRRRILNKVKELTPYLIYPKTMEKVA